MWTMQMDPYALLYEQRMTTEIDEYRGQSLYFNVGLENRVLKKLRNRIKDKSTYSIISFRSLHLKKSLTFFNESPSYQ